MQDKLSRKKSCYNKNKYLLKGKLYCKECGHPISVLKSMDGKRRYGSCSFYRKNSKVCTSHSFNYDKFEKLVFDMLDKIERIIIDKDIKFDIIYKLNVG